ncbi:MAG: PIN domain-containing protein [Acidobacteria bacterium]|nr:PIN domain-containing protein [Acidobacteriota bacterium]
MSKSPKIYWDTCVFIALIDMEKRKTSVLDGINACIDRVEAGEATLVTSTITRIEITKTKLDPKKEKRFVGLLSRRNVVERNVDIRVADIAREIRYTYSGENDDPKIKTPDAVHAATAIASEVDSMWTLDGAGDRLRPSDLLSLKSPICGKWNLQIEEPFEAQGTLFRALPSGQEPDADEEE